MSDTAKLSNLIIPDLPNSIDKCLSLIELESEMSVHRQNFKDYISSARRSMNFVSRIFKSYLSSTSTSNRAALFFRRSGSEVSSSINDALVSRGRAHFFLAKFKAAEERMNELSEGNEVINVAHCWPNFTATSLQDDQCKMVSLHILDHVTANIMVGGERLFCIIDLTNSSYVNAFREKTQMLSMNCYKIDGGDGEKLVEFGERVITTCLDCLGRRRDGSAIEC